MDKGTMRPRQSERKLAIDDHDATLIEVTILRLKASSYQALADHLGNPPAQAPVRERREAFSARLLARVYAAAAADAACRIG